MTTAFLTDKYELTMLAAALQSGVAHKKATFELFARRLPAGRKYGVVAGVYRAVEAVENFIFTEEQISFLRDEGSLSVEAIDYLENFKFSGTITSYRDGELFFPYSPIMTVTGTFAEAVILETVLLSIMNHDCAVASAASRMVSVADGRPLLELGSRRTHEDSAVSAAVAAYIAGFAGTSNLEAAHRYNLPVFGTSAHAFTLAHGNEIEAFEAQVAALGVETTLLVDTYDIEQGIRNAITVAGTELGAIRIDSGDLYEETVKARKLLDSLGATNTKIVLSSDIDEFVIDEVLNGGAEKALVDSFGAGTRVVTGSGHPTAGMVYKLVEIEDENGNMRPVAKASSGKKSIGGKKVVYRIASKATGTFVKEVVLPEAQDALLSTLGDDAWVHVPTTDIITNGDVTYGFTLEEARKLHANVRGRLDASARSIESGAVAIPTWGVDGEL